MPVEPPDEVADLADALNDLAAALATSEGRQREFLLSVSHELRTPLTTIRGYAEALADGVVGADGTCRRPAGPMLAEAEHLDRLIADLLVLARLEAADFPLEPVAGRPDPAGRATRSRPGPAGARRSGVPFRRGDAGSAGAGVHRSGPDPAGGGRAAGERAAGRTPGGAGGARGPAGPDPAAGGVLEVRDGGPGFTDDDLAVAFERGALHERYRGVRKVGSGLGLALAAGLVRRLGGEIAAGHAPEGGAAFTVRLPGILTGPEHRPDAPLVVGGNAEGST